MPALPPSTFYHVYASLHILRSAKINKIDLLQKGGTRILFPFQSNKRILIEKINHPRINMAHSAARLGIAQVGFQAINDVVGTNEYVITRFTLIPIFIGHLDRINRLLELSHHAENTVAQNNVCFSHL